MSKPWSALTMYVQPPAPVDHMRYEIERLAGVIQTTDKSIAEAQSHIVQLTTYRQQCEAKVTEYTVALRAIEMLASGVD